MHNDDDGEDDEQLSLEEENNGVLRAILKQSEQQTSSLSNILRLLWLPVIIVIIVIVVYVCYINVYLKDNYKLHLEWWNNGNNSSIYQKRFDMVYYLMYFEKGIYNTTSRYIQEKFISPSSILSDSQYIFLHDKIMPCIRITSFDGKKIGFLKPPHLIESIKFYIDPLDQTSFDAYCSKNKLDATVPYVKNGKTKDGKPNNGVYPENENATQWMNKFSDWFGSSFVLSKDGIYVPPETDNNEWFDTKKHPDNFFAAYGYGSKSPIVLSLCNTNYTSAGIPLFRSAAISLLSKGWLGFIQDLSGLNANEISNILNTDWDIKYVPKPPTADETCPATKKTSIGINAAMSGLGMASMAFCLPPPVNLFAFGAIALTGIGLGVASGMNDAKEAGCF